MAPTLCRIGIHRWGRVWKDDGPHRECRSCGSAATPLRVGWPIAAAGVVIAALAYIIHGRLNPPNYGVNATAECLRAEGYTVRRIGSRNSGNYGRNISVRRRSHYVTDLSFWPTRTAAKDYSETDSVPLLTRRNVVFDAEGDLGTYPALKPIVACLRTD